MRASGWADLYIDSIGKGRLFIAKQETPAEWYEMMNRQRDLLFSELAGKDYRLLGLVKDKVRLNECGYNRNLGRERGCATPASVAPLLDQQSFFGSGAIIKVDL